MGNALETFVENSRRLFILTGAGCSTNSGIPDYRDTDGSWTQNVDRLHQAAGSRVVIDLHWRLDSVLSKGRKSRYLDRRRQYRADPRRRPLKAKDRGPLRDRFFLLGGIKH